MSASPVRRTPDGPVVLSLYQLALLAPWVASPWDDELSVRAWMDGAWHTLGWLGYQRARPDRLAQVASELLRRARQANQGDQLIATAPFRPHPPSSAVVRPTPLGRACLSGEVPAVVRGVGPYRGLEALRRRVMRLEHRRTARECDLALRAALADDEVPHWVPMECRDGPADGHTGLVPCPPPGYVLVRVPGSDGDVAEEPYMPEPSEREVTGLPIPERRYCTDRAWRAFMARAEAQPMVGYRWARDLL